MEYPEHPLMTELTEKSIMFLRDIPTTGEDERL
jgi:hypothetical protein